MSRQMYSQPALLAGFPPQSRPGSIESTFADNMRLPVHRWFRYSAGFSADWAESVVARIAGSGATVLDPFAGSGTTLLAAEAVGVSSVGVEAHPFVTRVARAKLAYRTSGIDFASHARHIRQRSSEIQGDPDRYPELIRRIFDDRSLAGLDVLHRAQQELDDGSPASELAWLAIVAILRQVSHAGTAPWQYVLPNRTKKRVTEPLTAFDAVVQTMLTDMRVLAPAAGPPARMVAGDGRTCEDVEDQSIALVVTSPPYPNNFDYADATRIEMTFLGEIDGWGDLQHAVRRHLVRSCTQHGPASAVDLEASLMREEVAPIRDDLRSVCEELARVRHEHGGKKTYHLMVASYFLDLATTWQSLRRVCASPSTVCFVLGDSAPYGVYVPVIDWMGKLAEAAGFSAHSFEKIRDRNIKWKNRKHQVPLMEGLFWVQG